MKGSVIELRQYALESDLVSDFSACLSRGNTLWGDVRVAFEVDYVGGWSDVVALDAFGEVIAFEAKLRKWRDALHQAYRTKCFANRSYVVLPERIAQIALQHEHEFHRRGVGLCAVGHANRVELLIGVESSKPLQPWITARAKGELVSGGPTRECRTTSRKPRAKSVTHSL